MGKETGFFFYREHLHYLLGYGGCVHSTVHLWLIFFGPDSEQCFVKGYSHVYVKI